MRSSSLFFFLSKAYNPLVFPSCALLACRCAKERGRNNFRNYASQLQATFARSQIPKVSKYTSEGYKLRFFGEQ
jgi:hypothetical protein